METQTTIVARSHQQAMEWSLVLASQQIETSIQKSEDGTQWLLVIPAVDASRAFESLRLYRKENRKVHWEQAVPGTHLFFHWGTLGWVLWMICAHWLLHSEAIIRKGRMETIAVQKGEWWRLFTAVSLHADEGHLASNLIMGALIYGLAMAQFGAGNALLAGLLSGAAGNLAAMMVHGESHASLGASGMVMGGLGLLSVYFLTLPRVSGQRQLLRRSFVAGFLLLTLFGLNPETDVVAHVGGFLAGCFLGTLLPSSHHRWFNPINLVFGAGFVVLTILTWALAFSKT